MRIKGVNYDVGRVYMGHLMRPVFDSAIVRRELEIIKSDLHCNTVKIVGEDIERLAATAEYASQVRLDVWVSPDLFEKTQEETFEYTMRAAERFEELRRHMPNLVLSVGTELTGFMQGIVEGGNVMERFTNPTLWRTLQTGEPARALNEYLARTVAAVRQVYHGALTYASLAELEKVEWGIFDLVGLDLYRDKRNRPIYGTLIEKYRSLGKPIVITEFGCCTYRGAEDAGGMGFHIIDWTASPPKLTGNYVYDQSVQARELTDQLNVIESAGAEGAFVFEFVQPGPFDDAQAKELLGALDYDPDIAAYTLVKSLVDRRGTTYPDMPWEPKESFYAVAEYYRRQSG